MLGYLQLHVGLKGMFLNEGPGKSTKCIQIVEIAHAQAFLGLSSFNLDGRIYLRLSSITFKVKEA